MATAVARAIEAGEGLAVEAGTGVGKTFAYLVPLLLSGRRGVLSMSTQALQEQLFIRDIPVVAHALGLPVRVALLKGRSNYVCLHRVEQALQGRAPSWLRDPVIAVALGQVMHWAERSRTGDLMELSTLDEGSPLRPLITSTRQNCLGAACPRHAECHVNRARREALSADWVVINHHLFFSDQLLQESDVPAVLPRAEVLVFDEAHQLNDTGIAFLGRVIGDAQLLDLARDLARLGPLWARGQQPWAHLSLALEQATRLVGSLSRRDELAGARRRWSGAAPHGVDMASWLRVVAALDQALSQVQAALSVTAEASVDLRNLAALAHELHGSWRGIAYAVALEPPSGHVRWAEWGPRGQWRLVSAPPDSSAAFRVWLGEAESRPRSWIFSSATLGGDDALSWFTRGLGIDDSPRLRTLRVPSPFDHARQAALYVPGHLPETGDEAHAVALADAVARWASRLGGRTLLLTTTLRARARIAEHLRGLVKRGHCAPLQVLEQGRASRRALLAQFRDARSGAAVLVASGTFWEGLDLAGDALQLLVIDKLPFAPPDDPLMRARGERAEAQGLRAFNDVWLPEAAMALKQGAGRLIRSENDRGVLVIGDRRLLTRSYGNRLLAALPAMRRLQDEAEMEAALDELVATRSSTTDHPPT